MDARVNDFLDEINQIAPLNENKEEPVWEKCYDEDSGYYYFWNVKTNEVTWDMPSDYKSVAKSKLKKSSNLYIPPRTAPLFPSTRNLPVVSDAVKIYNIRECTNGASTSVKPAKIPQMEDENIENSTKPVRRKSQSDIEKVVLINAYGSSDSEDERCLTENLINASKSLKSPSPHSNDVDQITDKTPKPPKSKHSELQSLEGKAKSISGFSLVAGYSDSDDESAESEMPKEKISHSTLFPVVKPLDVTDFESTPKSEEGFDSKAFRRKRRIGIALVNTGKKPKPDDENERKGLGFCGERNLTDSPPYSELKSGSVVFVKADVLNPTSVPATNENAVEIEDTYRTLKEKLGFLSEGRDEVSPVQVMLIQIETLHSALKSGDLKHNYLRKWLDDTCSDLVKLEKETAPEGWLLEWDRSHKRYYYQHAETGESQWEYPQADVTVCDEAMDISTTPPPAGVDPTIHMSPPLPPSIASPSPPPPPVISYGNVNRKDATSEMGDAPTERCGNSAEPSPPGVDLHDGSKPKDNAGTDLCDALSSFYADIAAIETRSNSPVSNVEDKTDTEGDTSKKKKKKVKLAQGIAMKKKGVSKLVEKWKNVQLSLNDQ